LKHLPATLSAEAARARVEKSKSFRIDRLIAAVVPSFLPPLQTARPLPYLELVWMPQYLMTFAMHGRRGAETASVTVDGLTSQFALFFADHQLREGAPEGELPEPEIGPDRAEAIARRAAQSWLLRYHRVRKLNIGAMQSIEVLRYPFWVYYYQRRPGLLDLRVVDAVTSELPGSKLKYGVVRAFQKTADK
jgi:hypothetical protein